MYGKVFASLWEGTLYGRGDEQLVLIYMFANCDAEGYLDRTAAAIAGPLGWEVGRVQAALERLEAPDPQSRSTEQEGRRIVCLYPERGWGWTIVNYLKYRKMVDSETRKAGNRERKQRQRDRSRAVTQCHTESRQEEVEEEVERLESKEEAGHAEIHQERDMSQESRSDSLNEESMDFSQEELQANRVRVGGLVSSLSDRFSMTKPRGTPLLDSIRARVQALAPEYQRRVYQLAGWLRRKGAREDELVLRFIDDFLKARPGVPYSYYAVGGPAWNSIVGHWNADAQDNESRFWKDQDRDFVRRMIVGGS